MIELESSLEEDFSRNQAMWRVIESVKNLKKKEGVECVFCTQCYPLNTIRDLVKSYSSIVYCVVNHCEDAKTTKNENEDGKINLRDVFEVEMFILQMMVDPENLSVYEAMKGAYEKYEEIRKTLGILSEEYFSNSVSVIECEHDVESLSFRIYKKNREIFQEEELEYLLTVLYLRKEYTRFFRVFKRIPSISLYQYRLALSLTFNEDCDFETSEVLELKSRLVEKEGGSTLLSTMSNFDLLKDIFYIVDLSKEHSKWLEDAKVLFEWNEKVKIWSKNRNDCSGSVDKSMVEESIRARRWDDGWCIYKLGSKGVKEDFHKICILCIKALVDEKDELWVSRLLDVLEAAISMNKVDICCDIIDDLFDRINIIDEKYRFTILSEFIKKVSRMEGDEKVVNHIIRVISRLCRTCNGTEACEFCVDHVTSIYNEWKRNNTGGFFFKHHSKYETEIFENMMDLYCTIEDSNKFVGVCRDLVENDTKINKEMSKRIQNVHNKTCNNCCKNPTETRSNNQELLSHLFDSTNE
ncbi:hypothetical protein NGRA_2456 [Nosema granulosis]|uniref:Uncharacterized protein n=1 Tax=Nosema granulosis TaxID=83296 RepID=A0A9P6KYE9_9MICR|nr:hypothetical protein NGRA_2456 [Nosema granulosis]